MTKTERINKLNVVLKEFFANPQNQKKVAAKDLMPLFIKKGIFNKDSKGGLPIRNVLRDLDKDNQLDLIPFVIAERKQKNTQWFFSFNKNGVSSALAGSDRKASNKKSASSSHGRLESDEYYVIGLCNNILNRTASQQHKFDFLRGDNGRRLPVDAFYEDLGLVIEYHERQHSEPVRLFDKKMTVSGVNRGQQRKIYDERRKTVLPEHGIKLIVIDYSAFGSSKKIKRDYTKDLEIVKSIMVKNGII